MYRARGLHQKALQLLADKSVDHNCASTDASNLTRDVRNRDFRPLVQYLRELEDAPVDLVFEFADWILQEHPRAWISIFTTWEQEFRRVLRLNRNHSAFFLSCYFIV